MTWVDFVARLRPLLRIALGGPYCGLTLSWEPWSVSGSSVYKHMKKNESVYTDLFWELFQDIAERSVSGDTDNSIAADRSSIEASRQILSSGIEKRGLEFLTQDLVKFGKAFDNALANSVRLNWDLIPASCSNPELLRFLTRHIVDDSGDPIKTPDKGVAPTGLAISAFKQLRQLTQFLYKLNLPYDSHLSSEVIESFVRTDSELRDWSFDKSYEGIAKTARDLISRVCCNIHPRDIVPRHGPGSVSTGEKGPGKFNFSRIYSSLVEEYPFDEYFMVGVSQIADHLHWLGTRDVLVSGTAKVVLVPKDSRGPRIISCEPLEYQWIQQGLQRKLVDTIESHPLTRGHVNFRDQGINRGLALRGSKDSSLATLDMKDASDRVSLELVKYMFNNTALLRGLLASRSAATRLPDGRVIVLNKFAPMGSAVCFPVEALVFWAIAVSALVHKRGLKRREARKSVYVYGDDIICRGEDYPVVIEALEAFALKVNVPKCCVAGFFRESCGCDAFAGVDVTPLRLRTTWCHGSTSPSQLASYVDLSNRLWIAGYWRPATYIRRLVEEAFGPLPLVREYIRYSSEGVAIPSLGQVIGWYRPELDHKTVNLKRKIRYRFNRAYQRLEVFGYTIVPKRIRARTNGWQKLLYRLTCGSDGLPDGWYTVARRSSLKRTWGRF